MDCASYHIGTTQLASQFEALSCWPFTLCSTCNAARVIGLPRAVPCVSVSWTKDNLEEEYVPWFESREWGHKKIRDWFKNKHRGNKKLLFSKGNHMWLKRRLWLDGVSDRRRAKVGHTPAALSVACRKLTTLPASRHSHTGAVGLWYLCSGASGQGMDERLRPCDFRHAAQRDVCPASWRRDEHYGVRLPHR